MNKDLQRYKEGLIAFVLLLGYAFLHTYFTGVYTDTPLDKLLNFSVCLPFAQRLLIPLLLHPFALLPIEINQLFFLAEWIFIYLFYIALFHLLRLEFHIKEARLLSWLFILLLPLVTVINYRFTDDGLATFYYPADTPALLFMTLGFLWCLQAKWLYFIPWVFLATFNRESSILLVLLIPSLHWHNLNKVIKPLLLSLLAYAFARIIILNSLEVPGQLWEFFLPETQKTRFSINLMWLFKDLNLLLLAFGFAGLPLLWFTLYDYIPPIYRPVRYLALFYFIGLLLVGNFEESRIFGEIIILLYLPVCVAIRNWFLDLNPLQKKITPSFIHFINRYAIVGCFAFILIFSLPLNQLLLWFLRH